MKKSIAVMMFVVLSGLAIGRTIVLEGKYQNKNLYVQNGFSESGVGFCAYEVLINGQVATDEIYQTSFEIDFSQFGIKYGQNVTVEIRFKDDCSPRVLNPDALKAKATFEISSMLISPSGLLKWTSSKETGSLPYIIEQFKWNKWVQVGEVQGIGTPEDHTYTFSVVMNSGENKFRVKQIGYGALPKYSKAVSGVCTKSELTYTSNRHSNEIMFSGETLFEIYDVYGQVVKRGFGKNVDVTSLDKGNYFLCFDNSIAEFKKK